MYAESGLVAAWLLLAAGCWLLAAGCWLLPLPLPLRMGPLQLQQLLRVLLLLLLPCHTHLGVDATLDALSVAVSAAGACKAIQI